MSMPVSISVPMPVPTYLSSRNPHPRDVDISFEEGPHIYTIKGERGTYKSCTTWLHSHFGEFDANSVIDRILKSKKMADPSYIYFRMTKTDILTKWDNKRDSAAKAGTLMHYDIECYFNNMHPQNNSIEYGYFIRFTQDFAELRPYRTEWMVYYEEIKISGSIDMIFENPDGTLEIYDWKRCTEIQYENGFSQNSTTTCISHLPDTNFWHYALQLNMYRRILQDKYGKTVVGLYLVCLHPDNAYKSYERIEVPLLDVEMDALINLRKSQI